MQKSPFPEPPLEEQYRILKAAEGRGHLSQRHLARDLGYSLGKVNYLLQALMEKGFIKLENFRTSQNKMAYRYILTAEGLRAKFAITREFLQWKEAEYERTKREVEELREELGGMK